MKRGRLRLIGRWGVSFLAVMFLGATVLSWFYHTGVEYIYVHPYGSERYGDWNQHSVYIVDGRVWLIRIDTAYPGWNYHFGLSGFYKQLHPRDSSFKDSMSLDGNLFLGWKSIITSFGPGRQYYFSGFIPAGIFGLLAAISWRGVWLKRRLSRKGCCDGCGYSLVGLDGGVCPECGGGADDAAS